MTSLAWPRFRINRLVVVTALLVFAFGLSAEWGIIGTDSRTFVCYDETAAQLLGDTGSYDWELLPWPPGARCTYQLPDGSVIVERKLIQGDAWLTLALFSMLSGVIVNAAYLLYRAARHTIRPRQG